MRQEFGKPKLDPEGDLQLPCGKCTECKSKRAFDWATRAKHEMACHEQNTFITLTYDDKNLPSFLVVKSEFQKFLKKLRKKIKKKVKYIVSHEYGGRTGRPHHHAIIFGWEPSDQRFLQKAPSGEPLFESKDISELWTHGFHSIGEANEKTAYYIASYSLKSKQHEITNPDTGEEIIVSDTMDCSIRTAIGYEYFMNNAQQLVNTSNMLPRYYNKLMERHFPKLLEVYENKRNTELSNPRSAHQRLAKFEITEQKKDLSSDGFRSAPESSERQQYKQYLQSDRDMYHKKTKGNLS